MKGYRYLIRNIFIVLLIGLILSNINNTFVLANVNEEESSSEFVVCIDPGHQKKANFQGEPVAPGSSNKKIKVSAGTAGVGTKKPEHVVNLEASLILKEQLISNGNKVIMTRETEEVDISNVERAEVANNANANLAIRIHCDSINNEGKTGATILIPSKKCEHTSTIYEDSNKFAEILKEKLKCNDVKVNGIFERNDITGFNWSKVPVVILEMGFMSNYNEDRMLCNTEYQKKLMDCVSQAVDEYKLSLN